MCPDEVENIIESRARSADLSVNNYYDFLYSFHVTRQNFRLVILCSIKNLNQCNEDEEQQFLFW